MTGWYLTLAGCGVMLILTGVVFRILDRPRCDCKTVTIEVTAKHLSRSRRCRSEDSPVLSAIRDRVSPLCGLELGYRAVVVWRKYRPELELGYRAVVVWRKYRPEEVALPASVAKFELSGWPWAGEPFSFPLTVPEDWVEC
jgi:hypothetical protein